MSESNDLAEVVPSTSRRSALKAGVGLGVGLAAWSAPSITSLGGTPVYAAGCTFVLRIDLSDGCRNTDQGNCEKPAGERFAYHTLKSAGLPDGYSISNNAPEGVCCDQNWPVTFRFPEGITCTVVVRHALPDNCTGAVVGEYGIAPSSDGEIVFPLKCVLDSNNKYPPPTQYTIVANCNTTGAPEECLN